MRASARFGSHGRRRYAGQHTSSSPVPTSAASLSAGVSTRRHVSVLPNPAPSLGELPLVDG